MTIEKHRLATSTKMQGMLDSTKSLVDEKLGEGIQVLRADGHIATETSLVAFSDVKDYTAEELSTSPVKALQLRWVMARAVFSEVVSGSPISTEKLMKLVEMDPFLASQEELKRVEAVLHVNGVRDGREGWSQCKTVPCPSLPLACSGQVRCHARLCPAVPSQPFCCSQEAEVKDAVDLFNVQCRNLDKIKQCLLSSLKDYTSEKKELEKAWLYPGSVVDGDD